MFKRVPDRAADRAAVDRGTVAPVTADLAIATAIQAAAETRPAATPATETVAMAMLDSWGGSSNMHMKRGSSQMSQMLDQLLIVDLVQAIQWTEWNNEDGGRPDDSSFFGVGEIGGLGVGAGLASVGYVLWALRGGVLLTTIFGSMPAWRMIDPSALLTVYRDAEGVRKSKADVTTFLD